MRAIDDDFTMIMKFLSKPKSVFIVVMLFAMMSASCSRKTDVAEPALLLSEKQMIDVMADVQVVEAELNRRKSVGESVSGVSVSYYDQLFRHYGINEKVLEQNMDYYTHNVEILDRIMDSVVNRLVNEQNSLPGRQVIPVDTISAKSPLGGV